MEDEIVCGLPRCHSYNIGDNGHTFIKAVQSCASQLSRHPHQFSKTQACLSDQWRQQKCFHCFVQAVPLFKTLGKWFSQTPGKPTPNGLLKHSCQWKLSRDQAFPQGHCRRQVFDDLVFGAAFKEERELWELFLKPNTSDWMIQPRI